MDGNEEMFHTYLTPAVVIVMVAIFCALLVSEIPMFSLKIKHWVLKGNELRLALLIVGLISIILLGLGGLSVTILLYTLFSIVVWLVGLRKETKESNGN